MNKTGIPALGELPVPFTDAPSIHTHARTETHNLQAHRGAQTHKLTPSLIHPATPPVPLRETQTPGPHASLETYTI